MGLFDFLKVSVKEQKPAKTGRLPVRVVEFDGRSYPITSLTTKSLVASGFDGSLIAGQNARVSVRIDDGAGKFSFSATLSVMDTRDRTLTAGWMMLPAEVDSVIRQYNQIRKQREAKGAGK